MPSRTPSPSNPPSSDLAHRIIEAARTKIFSGGLRALTMDDLAEDLGISKKTLYVHFPGKEAIAEKIVDLIAKTMRSRFDAVFDNKDLTFTEKMCEISDIIGNTVARVSPSMLREFQRNAPVLFQKIDELRQKNIPYVFGRLLREGQEAGVVRADLDVAFTVEFWLQAIRGLMHPDSLDRTHYAPRDIIERAIPLLFRGLLTPEGAKEFSRHKIACAKAGDHHLI